MWEDKYTKHAKKKLKKCPCSATAWIKVPKLRWKQRSFAQCYIGQMIRYHWGFGVTQVSHPIKTRIRHLVSAWHYHYAVQNIKCTHITQYIVYWVLASLRGYEIFLCLWPNSSCHSSAQNEWLRFSTQPALWLCKLQMSGCAGPFIFFFFFT